MKGLLLNEPAGFPAAAVQRLRALGPVHEAGAPYPAADIEAVFVRLQRRIGADFHARHPALRWVVSPTTGTDHLDLAYFEDAGIQVLTLRGRTAFLDHIHATAEHTLALLLALLRRIPAAVGDVAAGHWNRYPFQGRELHGKNVLLGHGRIGRQVRVLYEAFGCHVVAHDVVAGKVPPALTCRWPDALSATDVLSVHVDLDDATRGLVGAPLLDRLPPHAVLVNTSRGEVVDQPALFERLAEGRLAGAALDVLAGEPEPLAPAVMQALARIGPRIVVTPHIAGYTHESLTVVENHVADLLIAAAGNG